jgi:hypothetical protein
MINADRERHGTSRARSGARGGEMCTFYAADMCSLARRHAYNISKLLKNDSLF